MDIRPVRAPVVERDPLVVRVLVDSVARVRVDSVVRVRVVVLVVRVVVRGPVVVRDVPVVVRVRPVDVAPREAVVAVVARKNCSPARFATPTRRPRCPKASSSSSAVCRLKSSHRD